MAKRAKNRQPIQLMMDELPKVKATDGIEGADICKGCGGVCCQSSAGVAWPSDFGEAETLPDTLTDVLTQYLKTGYWAVDYWDVEYSEVDLPPDQARTGAANNDHYQIDESAEALGLHENISMIYFVRPAHTNAIGRIVDHSKGGTCRLWHRKYGCRLPLENRPRQCRFLTPEPNDFQRKFFGCQRPAHSANEAAAIAWLPYQAQIKAAVQAAQRKR